MQFYSVLELLNNEDDYPSKKTIIAKITADFKEPK